MTATITRPAALRSIALDAPQVRAVLNGRQSQLRFPVRHIPMLGEPLAWCAAAQAQEPGWVHIVGDYRRFCPYGEVGSHLWVKETYICGGNNQLLYCATEDTNLLGRAWENGFRQTPCTRMRQWESRITLEILNLRVERLQSITTADAQAQGMVPWYSHPHVGPYSWMRTRDDKCKPFWDGRSGWHPSSTAQDAYRRVWECDHSRASWAANPWVWVVEFGARVNVPSSPLSP